MVEDCRRLADLVAEGLSDEGIATDVAYDGTAAASKLDHNAYDVVVLDRALPGVHGDVLCQKIARTEGRSMVLMLSGSESPADRAEGLSLGADAVLEASMLAAPGYLSAEQLLERVWDENTDPFTKTVSVTVGRLRHKLGEPPVIVTIPRVGYRIMPGGPARSAISFSAAVQDSQGSTAGGGQ